MQRILFLFLAILFSGCAGEEFSEYTEPERTVAMPYSDLEGITTHISGWSKTATLRSYTPSVRETLQADFTSGPGAGTYTVQFELGDYDPATFINPMAEITWSVEGNSVTRHVSLRDGVSVSGVGEGVRVTVWDACVPFIDGSVVPAASIQDYKVNIVIAQGVRGPSGSPPTLIPFVRQTVAGGIPTTYMGYALLAGTPALPSSASVEIPLSVGVNAMFITIGSENYQIITDAMIAGYFMDITGTVLGAFSLASYNTWVPLPQFCTSLVILRSAALTENAWLTIQLGIDG
jgi:hypothetical protein